jgi:hypothetical protein
MDVIHVPDRGRQGVETAQENYDTLLVTSAPVYLNYDSLSD